MTSELALFGSLVLLGLGDDGVHRDGGLAGGAVTDDQLTLTTADWDHGVDAHDAGLHRNGHRFTGDDARSEFFDRILRFTFDVALAVDGLTEGVDHAAEEALANRNGEEAAGRFDFVTCFDAFTGAEEHAADFGFFKVEREAEHTAGELDHFVEHDIAQAFNLGGAVTDFTDDAHIGLRDGGLEAGDLGFDLLEDVAHGIAG